MSGSIFQSPCYRVRQCNVPGSARENRFFDRLSVPLLSGQTVQRELNGKWINSAFIAFSPLVIGSDSATGNYWKIYL